MNEIVWMNKVRLLFPGVFRNSDGSLWFPRCYLDFSFGFSRYLVDMVLGGGGGGCGAVFGGLRRYCCHLKHNTARFRESQSSWCVGTAVAHLARLRPAGFRCGAR